MSRAELLEQAKKLPFPERVELAQSLWNEIMDGFEPTLSPEEAALIDQRLEEHERTPDDVVSREDLRARLDARFKR